MKKKLLLMLLIGVLSMFGLAACGSSDTDTDTDSENTESSSEKETDDSEEFSFKELESEMSEAYMGLLESGEGVYYAGNEDGSFGILVILNAETSENASFVGTVDQTGDNQLTITDESSEMTLTFNLVAQDDGTIAIDMGDIGKGAIAECKVSEVLDALDTISENTDSVN